VRRQSAAATALWMPAGVEVTIYPKACRRPDEIGTLPPHSK